MGIKEVNPFEVRYQLLLDAMNYVGVCQPEEAVWVWAEGLKLRNAAIQYSVMSVDLRKEYISRLEEHALNWVTGVSSPWVDSIEITGIEEKSKTLWIVFVKISTVTSAGPYEKYDAKLMVEKEDKFWRIDKILGDEKLEVYIY